MLSVKLIERHFATGRLDQLLEAVASNGMELPVTLRIRLGQVPVSAAAMGLRRLIELTYGPTTLSRQMTQFLIAAQEPDGSFGHDPLPTALVVSTLDALLTEQQSIAEELEITSTRQRALAALAAMQSEDGLFHAADRSTDRTQQERALTSAFVIHLLANDEDFRSAVRFADALDWFDQHRESLDGDTQRLWTMASVGDVQHHSTGSAAVNAIAA